MSSQQRILEGSGCIWRLKQWLLPARKSQLKGLGNTMVGPKRTSMRWCRRLILSSPNRSMLEQIVEMTNGANWGELGSRSRIYWSMDGRAIAWGSYRRSMRELATASQLWINLCSSLINRLPILKYFKISSKSVQNYIEILPVFDQCGSKPNIPFKPLFKCNWLEILRSISFHFYKKSNFGKLCCLGNTPTIVHCLNACRIHVLNARNKLELFHPSTHSSKFFALFFNWRWTYNNLLPVIIYLFIYRGLSS